MNTSSRFLTPTPLFLTNSTTLNGFISVVSAQLASLAFESRAVPQTADPTALLSGDAVGMLPQALPFVTFRVFSEVQPSSYHPSSLASVAC